MPRSALPAVTALAACAYLACGGGTEATGKGGYVFGQGGQGQGGAGGAGGQPTTSSGSAGSGGGSTCHEGAACTIAGKLGACAAGKIHCDAKGSTCAGPAPAKETCNGVDDNCDGTTDEGCAVTVEVVHLDGTTTGAMATTAFPIGGKASVTPDVIFGGTDPGDGFMTVTSASPLPILGLAVVVPGAAPVPTHALAPTGSSKSASKTVVFPAYHFGGTDQQAHTISLVNDGGTDATVAIHVIPDGAPAETLVSATIAKHGVMRTDAPTLLGGGPVQGTGWIAVDSTQPLVGFYEEWSKATDRAADAAWPPPAKNVTLPFAMVGGAYDTVLRLATRSAVPVTLQVRVHAPGLTTAPVQLMLGGGARSESRVGIDLFPNVFKSPTAAWIELTCDAEVAVSALVTDGDHSGVALVGPAGAFDTVHYVADAAIGDAVTTDLLLANPNDDAAGAVLEVYGADGTPLRRADVTVAPGGAFEGSLGQLFGLAALDGWVRVTSDKPITGGYARHDGPAGIGATALQRGLDNHAIVPDVRSLVGADRTQITMIQPDRRVFVPAP